MVGAEVVALPRSSKRPRFQTQSLGDSDEEDGSGGRWEGTGGLLQHLNSGDELTIQNNSKWSVWTPQVAGMQYVEPSQAAEGEKGVLDSAVADSKEVSKKCVPTRPASNVSKPTVGA